MQDSHYRSKNASHITPGFNARSGRRKDPRKNSLHTKGIYCSDHEDYIDSVLREIYDAHKAALPMPSNRDGELANYVPKDTVETKRQLDLATRMMLEQASSPSSNGITHSRQYFNFPWIALIEQLSQSTSS